MRLWEINQKQYLIKVKQILTDEIYPTDSERAFRRQPNASEAKVTTKSQIRIRKSTYTELKLVYRQIYKLSSLPEGDSPVSIVSYRNQGEFVALDQVQHSSLRSF